MRSPRVAWLVSPVLVAVLLAGCRRETREVRPPPELSARPDAVRLTPLQPGVPVAVSNVKSPYRENAYGISEGKRLYEAFNCIGCHADGGGGIGPALMDDEWIYGSAPEQIYSTIVQGRPDGMPSFGGRIPAQQIWQLVAYVESMSLRTPRDASPGRTDDLLSKHPEARTERLDPRQTGHR